jgi:hypothetical protein
MSPINPQHWMADMTELVNQPLFSILFPGTHDSGAYGFTRRVYDGDRKSVAKALIAVAAVMHIPPVPTPLELLATVSKVAGTILNHTIETWGQAQSRTILGQLNAGIRFLDLRVMYYDGQFYIYHGFLCDTVDVALRDIKIFLDENKGEVVFVHFGDLRNMLVGGSQQRYHDLVKLIKTGLDYHIYKQDNLQYPTRFQRQLLKSILFVNQRAIVLFQDNGEFSERTQYSWLGPQRSNFFTDLVQGDSASIGELEAKATANMSIVPLTPSFQNPGWLPWTATPDDSTVESSVSNQLNPFTGTHGLQWFSTQANARLADFLRRSPEYTIGLVTVDFFEDSKVVELAISRNAYRPTYAAGPIDIASYGGRAHVTYPDLRGMVQYLTFDGWWYKRPLDERRVKAPTALRFARPTLAFVNGQLCIIYRDSNSAVQFMSLASLDDGNWTATQINVDTGAAATDPFAIFYRGGSNILYGTKDGILFDRLFYNGAWSTTRLNQGGVVADAPIIVGTPSAAVIGDQLHIVYRDSNGAILDMYQTPSAWGLAYIIRQSTAVTDPRIIPAGNQAHVVFCDANGMIQDLWNDGSGNWTQHQLNGGGVARTNGPAAFGNPCGTFYHGQFHVIYREQTVVRLPADPGNIWDICYVNNQWGVQLLNNGGTTMGPAAGSEPAVVVNGDELLVVYVDQHHWVRELGFNEDFGWSAYRLS